MRQRLLACRRQSVPAGSDIVVVCLPSRSPRWLVAISRLLSVRKSRCCGFRARVCVVLPGRWARSASTISRELRRNAATRGGKLEYRASVAQWKSELVAQRPKTVKLLANGRLRDYVQDRLSGAVKDANGVPISGPATQMWKGRNKPHRQDRRWATVWSPEQIAGRLRIDYPHDRSMRISHEAIYQALYVQSRGALTRDLVTNLRTGRSLRVPRSRARHRPGGHVGCVSVTVFPAFFISRILRSASGRGR